MSALKKLLVNEQVDQFTLSHTTDAVNLESAGQIQGLCALAVVLVSTPTAKTFDAGNEEVATVTFPDFATFVENDYVIVTAQDGLTYAVSGVKAGGVVEPTGPLWVAIPAGRKALVDLTGLTTAAQVAAAFEVAFDALTGFTAKVVTDDTAADGSMLFTQTARGLVADPVPKSADDAGAGTISVVISTPGQTDETNETANSVYIPAHGLPTGLKGQLTTTGTLPSNLSLATDYFIIVVDADNVKFATSYANALAGTAIDIGAGADASVHTFTPTSVAGGTIKPQVSIDGTNWADLKTPEGAAMSQNITASGNFVFNLPQPFYSYFRLAYGLTAGYLEATTTVVAKGLE